MVAIAAMGLQRKGTAMLRWTMLHPRMTKEALGYIPNMLHELDPRPAKEQIDDNYVIGWHEFKGFSMDKTGAITYPDDPTYHPLAMAKLRDETIYFYQHAWVAIVQLDGSYEIARLD